MSLTVDDLPEGGDEMAGAFLASDYHGGMMTALYALASSGSLELYKGEGLSRIVRELREAVAIAESGYPEDADSLLALLVWCESRLGVACDECGHPCHADDAVSDGVVALCGSLRGNGCADRQG